MARKKWKTLPFLDRMSKEQNGSCRGFSTHGKIVSQEDLRGETAGIVTPEGTMQLISS
jgi:hypothetical protein